MGFLDNLTRKALQTDQDGRYIYYPLPLSQGYIIPSEAEFQRITKNLKKYYLGSFLLFLVSLALIPVIGKQADLRGGILVIYLIILLEIWLYCLYRHLKQADGGLTFHERIVKRATRVPIELLISYEIVCIGFVIAAIFIICIDWRHWIYSLSSLIAIGFFGYRGVIVTKMLMAKG